MRAAQKDTFYATELKIHCVYNKMDEKFSRTEPRLRQVESTNDDQTLDSLVSQTIRHNIASYSVSY